MAEVFTIDETEVNPFFIGLVVIRKSSSTVGIDSEQTGDELNCGRTQPTDQFA